MNHTPKLLMPSDYIAEATRTILAAKSRVTFLCMMVDDDHATKKFIDALCQAAERGVEVTVAADVFTYGELGGHLIPVKYYRKRTRSATSVGRRLSKSGVKFTWLGRFTTTPFNGRTHIKCLVVDDTVFSFGGVNLDDESISHTDYMFRCKNKQLAMELSDDIMRMIKNDRQNFSFKSHEFSFGGDNDKVLIDGGFQGDSLIFRRACALAKKANHVLLVSQYGPTSRLGRILKKTDNELYFNQPNNTNNLINSAVIKVGMFFSGHKSRYTRDAYLHAKFMIFTMPDGEKVAITGSHNFVYAGVLLGTREIALETRDKKVIAQLEKFFKANVA